jgi:hypothetical protein
VRALLLVAWGWSGCYAPTISPGLACESACPRPEVCVDHVCRPPGVAVIDAASDTGDSVLAIDAPPGDGDGDGVGNLIDNCPAIANPDQHDEDLDKLGDRCDPCPHLMGTALDSDGDGVGDACDPQPQLAKQQIKLFDPFTSTLPVWSSSAGVSVVGDQMRIPGGRESNLAIGTGELRIATRGTVTAVATAIPHQLLIAFGFNTSDTRYHYGEFYDDNGTSGDVLITEANGSVYSGLASATYAGVLPTGEWSMQIDESVKDQRIALLARLGGMAYPALVASTSTAPVLAADNRINISTNHVDITLDYFLVIETVP